ncbi:MAG: prepilin-type N-terminal cleavage/methylation domain-containing protein, partial [Bacteriovorax sp.]|nr:prepilin-type N-terminal cleavage/methylation domain-containing protein [Bacteriovorax sp.]
MGFFKKLSNKSQEFRLVSWVDSGFSLMETMVAVAILGVMVATVISQLRSSYLDSLNVGADAEINNITNRVISEIGDQ